MKAYPLTNLCRLFQVSRSGFYRFMGRPERPKDDAALVAELKAIFASSKGTYGARRMTKRLCERGFKIGRHRARTLMRRYGLHAALKPRL